jgi:hypothetical protein
MNKMMGRSGTTRPAAALAVTISPRPGSGTIFNPRKRI